MAIQEKVIAERYGRELIEKERRYNENIKELEYNINELKNKLGNTE